MASSSIPPCSSSRASTSLFHQLSAAASSTQGGTRQGNGGRSAPRLFRALPHHAENDMHSREWLVRILDEALDVSNDVGFLLVNDGAAEEEATANSSPEDRQQ
uniref:Uncharacterized protein n=1 Tax=Entomoneis paludosa TaxID=265537 RepID=A0A7S3DY59_9STRA|mmetsp:Transcript_9288/g.19301  ORF Transcript_9288/g.19301 Transcript_9288/m.19301 type:complete len:103 (+) Transcript_9288:230-538(+)|eukprot:CAMPEP_0172467456 /NCGR_PEP_ID=MMETSP1065-20121228/58988_1 /TAXON_ID=265537 /ORGANISM="Amphiprora paludosa, Strain CCMP125" /LENGTH=102 /DNA_ID=CAMNT_0013224593 /DNA_START=206 /DNA_END=514 /DNA_ORIENTATION=-